MKRLILMSLLTMATSHAVAVEISDNRSPFIVNDNRNEDVRKKIGLDYSMPDYETSRIDERVIGQRLTLILQWLSKNYKNSPYNSFLVGILTEQEPKFQYAFIEKMKIVGICKSGNEITIRINLNIKKKSNGITNPCIILSFVDGVSESTWTNELFSYITRYIKE